MIGFGIPETEICLLIKNPATGKPINLATFRKYFAAEIATGAAKVKSLVGNCIVASILGREGGLTDQHLLPKSWRAISSCSRTGWLTDRVRRGLPSCRSCGHFESTGDRDRARSAPQELKARIAPEEKEEIEERWE
jgi:hypothetical protein